MGVLSGIYYERDFLNSVCKLGTIENTDERKEKIRCYNATIKEITEQNKANKFFDSEFLQKLNIRAENSTFPSFCFEGNHEALIQYVYH